MSFLNKLKKIFKEEKLEETEIETISLEQLYSKLDNKLKENSEKSEKLKKEVAEEIYQFDRRAREAVLDLEKIDISQKKEHEKIKLVVKENLNLYVNHLKKLLSDLKNVKKLETEEYIKKIFLILNEFDRISYMAFEKATILIGKEMGSTRGLIKDLRIEIKRVLEGNREFFEKNAVTNQLNSLLQELKSNKTYLKELESYIEGLNHEINKTKEEREKIKQKIEEIKSGEDYKKDLTEKEEHRKKLQELEKEIRLLKQKVDLKLLAKHFHQDKKKNQIVRNYSSDFKSALESDKDLELVKLVKEAQNLELNMVEEIQKRMSELSVSLTSERDKEIFSLENNLKKLESRISSIATDIENEIKKRERLAVKREKIVQEIKELVKKIFANLEVE